MTTDPLVSRSSLRMIIDGAEVSDTVTASPSLAAAQRGRGPEPGSDATTRSRMLHGQVREVCIHSKRHGEHGDMRS